MHFSVFARLVIESLRCIRDAGRFAVASAVVVGLQTGCHFKSYADGPSPPHKALEDVRFICYSPSTGNPEKRIEPTLEEMEQDIRAIRDAGFTGLVTYTASGMQGKELLSVAERCGIKAIIVGVWDCNNEKEIGAARACANSDVVVGYCVGNEGLDKRYSHEELKRAMEELRGTTGKLVTTTEEIDDYYRDERLVELSDWVFCNAHPYFHSQTDPERAVRWTKEAFARLQRRSKGKYVLFKEVGLPTAGSKSTRLSEQGQMEYYLKLRETDVRFCYFEYCDLPWKDHLPIEPHWGIFRSDRSPKLLAQHLLESARQRKSSRGARGAAKTPTTSRRTGGSGKRPIFESDGTFSIDRSYVPSGIIGDVGDIGISTGSEGAVRFTFTPNGIGPHEWDYKYLQGRVNEDPARQAGVVWLNPPGDFGKQSDAGFDLRNLRPKSIVWEARSLEGTVNVRFFMGGNEMGVEEGRRYMVPSGGSARRFPVSYSTRNQDIDGEVATV